MDEGRLQLSSTTPTEHDTHGREHMPTPHDTPSLSYPPHVLREYALLGDGERGAIVGPRGDIAWMCAPRWDSDAVFSSLIGGEGIYAITPQGRFVWGGYYEEGTLIWRSRWTTETSIIECREALSFPARGDRVVVLRRVIALHGPAKVQVLLDLRGNFGKQPVRSLRQRDGCWTGQLGELSIRWSGGGNATTITQPHHSHALSLELELAPGDQHDFVLELGEGELDADPVDAARAWQATEHAWSQAVPRFESTLAPRDTRHSYAVLRGLTSASGAMVAAATMSLPERAEAGRNYDYRYSWIRDQCYAGQAVASVAPHPLLDDAVRFVSERLLEDGPGLCPAYTSLGQRVPDQQALDVAGYPGGTALKGNWVNQQFQLDAFGESLLLFAAAARHDHLDAQGWRAAEIAAQAIADRWQQPDAGIWELAPQAWTHSRLICAAGLRKAAQVTSRHSPGQGAEWMSLADTIVADTAKTSVHPSGRWQRSATDARLDGALLLPPLRGAVAASDPRTVATLHAYIEDLTDGLFAYRFHHDDRELGKSEGAFVLCGFIVALALHQQGEETQAVRWFERNRAACGPPGLFTEEFDVSQRQLRGNLPQAFVHALLLETSTRLTRPWGTDDNAGP